MKNFMEKFTKKISPFFILGNPRSGTSLFRLMLNSHPHMVIPPESGFLQWWYSKYNNWSLEDSTDEHKVIDYVTDLLSSKKIEDWNLDKETLIKVILTEKPINYLELSTLVYLSYKNNSNLEVLRIGDKNNYFIHHLNTLNRISPKAKYIHLIRDGRDVACSYRNIKQLKSTSVYKPNLVYSIEDIAKEWKLNITSIANFLVDKPHLKIRYEDLLFNPEMELKKVCEFLEISYNDTMLNFYQDDLNDEPLNTRDWKMKTLEPLDNTNSLKYLKILSQEEIQIFNKINLDLLKNNGYDNGLYS